MTTPRHIAHFATVAVFMTTAMVGGLAAQPRDNPIERARHHMELGQKAFSQENFEDAEQQFIDAYAASPFPAFLYNAGLAAEGAGKNERAAELYRRYLDEEPEARDAAEIDVKIRTLLAEAPTETLEGEESPGVPEVQISEVEMKSLISVRTNPADAKIRILDAEGNEITAFEGPAAQTVVKGMYTLEASHPDYRTVQTNIHVTAGQVYIVVVEMSQGAFLGFLHVSTDVPGAAVFVDDKNEGQVGTTPWGNVLPTGKHKIWIEKPGYEPVERETEINIGDKQEMTLKLKRLPFGILEVKSNVDNAKVSLDGLPVGGSPLEHESEAGTRKVVVSAEGMKNYETDIEIGKGQTTKLLVRLNPKPSRTSAWVSMGVAVALFTGGGIAGGMALKTHRELEDDQKKGRLSDGDPRILHGFLWALSADIAFGVGAIVTGLCVYYFLRDPLPESEGKIYDPKDFEQNPDAAAETEVEGTPSESASAETRILPKFALAPVLTPNSAGLGLAVVF